VAKYAARFRHKDGELRLRLHRQLRRSLYLDLNLNLNLNLNPPFHDALLA